LITEPFGRWRRKYFHLIFAVGIFYGEVCPYAAIPFIVAFSPGHIEIAMFLPWSSIGAGDYLDRAKRKNSKSCSDNWLH
jgi:hypothetical protein